MAITVPPNATGSVLFQGRASTSQNLATSNAWLTVALDLEDVDDDNGHSNTTNNTRWTAARTAKYDLSGVVHFYAGSAVGLRQVCLFRNGAQLPWTPGAGWSSNTGAITTVASTSIWVDLAAGDYIELAAQTGAAAGAPTTQSYVGGNYFPMLRIRLVR